jgi:hypothetical protein
VIAANAVMAGACPTMPVVLAGVRAMARPGLQAVRRADLAPSRHAAVHRRRSRPPGRWASLPARTCSVPPRGLTPLATGGLNLIVQNVGGATPPLIDPSAIGHPWRCTYCTAEHDDGLRPAIGGRPGGPGAGHPRGGVLRRRRRFSTTPATRARSWTPRFRSTSPPSGAIRSTWPPRCSSWPARRTPGCSRRAARIAPRYWRARPTRSQPCCRSTSTATTTPAGCTWRWPATRIARLGMPELPSSRWPSRTATRTPP